LLSFRFHEWPETALISVAQRFIQDVDSLPKDYHDSVAQFMAYVHSSVNEMSVQYLTVRSPHTTRINLQ
jgi:dynein heavy chain, axonemal